MSPAAAILALALVPSAALAAEVDPDFEPERTTFSSVLGPAGAGTAVVSADVGWLRSGIGAALGVAGFVDVVLHADTMLLYRGFDGQTGFSGGLRLAPISGGAFRMSVEATVGMDLVPDQVGRTSVTVFRGEVALGMDLGLATPYARLAVRRLSSSSGPVSGSTHDEEAGLGLERALGRFAVAAEAFTWARPGHTGYLQWRIRGALRF